MRENRTSGSEGGGTKPIVSPYPYFNFGLLHEMEFSFSPRFSVGSDAIAMLIRFSRPQAEAWGE